MTFTKAEIMLLIDEFRCRGETFEPAACFFEDCIAEGLLDFGLSVPGSTGSAVVIIRMQKLFPYLWHIFTAPVRDMPFYCSPAMGAESPVSLWRLKLGK